MGVLNEKRCKMGQIIINIYSFFIISMTHKSEDYKISAVSPNILILLFFT